MKRITMMLALTALLVVALSLSAVSALAANAPAGCTKERGTIICPVEGGPGQGQDQVQTESKKGSVNSSHDTQSACTSGAGGSGKCSPGQFRNTDSPLP
jgi:hypothetical protein